MSLARNLAWPMAAAKPELLLLLLSWLAVDDISMPRLQIRPWLNSLGRFTVSQKGLGGAPRSVDRHWPERLWHVGWQQPESAVWG